MRPAVYASVLRNRKSGVRRVKSNAPHQFSWRRFFIMLTVGAFMFIPGLVVTIIGIENAEDIANMPGDRVVVGYNTVLHIRLYKVIGPAALACGVGLLLAAGIYYCCWGFQRPIRSRHTSKHRKHKEEHLDPLQAKTSSVPAISQTGHSTHSAYSSVRSQSSPTHRTNKRSPSWSPDRKSDRHHSNHHHSHHRSSSKSPRTPEGSLKGYQHNSRHRSSSAHHHNSHHHHHSSHQDKPVLDNQVTFVDTDAPLAQGESGSVDISIDMEVNETVEVDKKY